MWAVERSEPMIKLAIPVLHISEAAAAERFYCSQLGFRLEFAYRPDGVKDDPCYMGVRRDRVWLHLSSFSGDGVAGGVANFIVDDVDQLHSEFVARGVPIAVGPVDQTWGNREMYVRDADGNSIRFSQQ
jgi:catechol 2,3-dioxygenase-like lactoylglutathione lyase family enzyme